MYTPRKSWLLMMKKKKKKDSFNKKKKFFFVSSRLSLQAAGNVTATWAA
jgi:hypothetical protein